MPPPFTDGKTEVKNLPREVELKLGAQDPSSGPTQALVVLGPSPAAEGSAQSSLAHLVPAAPAAGGQSPDQEAKALRGV